MIAEGFGFQGATGGVVFGVEIEDDFFPFVLGKGYILPVIRGQGEGGGFVPDV